MAGPAVDIRGFISRILPAASTDDSQNTKLLRAGRYDELYSLSPVRKSHILADEGSYFIANGGNQTAITGSAGTAYSGTAAQLVIYNSDSTSNPNAKRIYLDYHYLLNGGTASSNSTSNTNTYYAIYLDTGNRYSSAGTNLTSNIVNPNMDLAARASVANVYFGAVVTTAATGAARAIVPQRLFRAPVSGTALTLANVDQWRFNFGGVESSPANSVQASATVEATMVDKSFNLPPIVIGPNQSFVMSVWQIVSSAPVAATYLPEVAWWER